MYFKQCLNTYLLKGRRGSVGCTSDSSIINVSLSKKLHPYCLVLVGSRNGFERDITIELK